MPVAETMNVEEAKAIPVSTGRYQPRKIHVDKALIGQLIGAASHVAWKILAKRNRKIKVPFGEHKKLTGALMSKWSWEVVEGQL